MKNMDGKRLNNADLCNLAENYAEIIKSSGIDNINNQLEYDYLLELKDQLKDQTDSDTNEEVITLKMKLSSTIKNIYRFVVAKEIECNTPQWISLSKRIFESNETLQYN